MRGRRTAVKVALAMVAAAATLLGATPATATTAFGPPVRVTPKHCSTSRVTMDATGWNRGFVICIDTRGHQWINFVSGWSNQPWHREVFGQATGLLAAADDGASTFGLYTVSGGAIRMVKRTHAGYYTSWTLAHPASSDAGTPGSGALVAVNGKWWADWGVPVGGGCMCFELWQAKTMGTAQAARWTGRYGRDLSLVATSDHAVELARIPQGADYGGAVTYTWINDLSWSSDHVLPGVPATSVWPVMVRTSDKVLHIAWVQNSGYDLHNIWYADNRGGSWHLYTKLTPQVNVLGEPPAIAYSDGHLFVGWTHLASGRYISHVADRYQGTWTERTVGDGSTTDSGSLIESLAATGGRARVVLEHLAGSISYSVVRKQG